MLRTARGSRHTALPESLTANAHSEGKRTDYVNVPAFNLSDASVSYNDLETVS